MEKLEPWDKGTPLIVIVKLLCTAMHEYKWIKPPTLRWLFTC